MTKDYGKGAGFVFQWMLSLYIYTLFKNDSYIIDKRDLGNKDFKIFKDNILKFRNKCYNKFGNDLNTKIEIMLEGEELCFEDINLLSKANNSIYDNLIFIQVKTKGGEDAIITKNDGVLKAIKNFVQNINFQKDKMNGNYLFIIFTNNKLSKVVNNISKHHADFYISMVDFIIKDNNKRKKTKNLFYPDLPLNCIGNNSIISNKLVLDLLYKPIEIVNYKDYDLLYTYEYIKKLDILIKDLKTVVNNLIIIKSIKFDTLRKELIDFYSKPKFLELKDIFELLSYDKAPIKFDSPLFEKYKNFLFTYFSPNNGGTLISDIDIINKGKFVDSANYIKDN